MDFINCVTEKAGAAKDKVVVKAGQVKEVVKLKGRIATCDEVLQKNYLEIGKLYYEMYGDNPGEEFAKACSSIMNARRGKEELEQQLELAKRELQNK